jgi:hypothetical protein
MSAQEKATQAAVDAWTHPVGTPVIARKDDGSAMETETLSMPWALDGVPAIMVRGVPGLYELERVTVVTP